jgi:hypothetical protein
MERIHDTSGIDCIMMMALEVWFIHHGVAKDITILAF